MLEAHFTLMSQLQKFRKKIVAAVVVVAMTHLVMMGSVGVLPPRPPRDTPEVVSL
jgi:hypothetical protein